MSWVSAAVSVAAARQASAIGKYNQAVQNRNAQVAEQENVKWLIVRVISDQADDDAYLDFDKFLQEFKIYSWQIIESFLNYISK